MTESPSSSSAALVTATPQTLAASAQIDALSVASVLGHIALIQQIMGAAMRDGEHYGKIPGCGDKPTLLQPGAQKLCLTFMLSPTYVVDERHLDEKGNREYRVTCTLTAQRTGIKVGEGVGTCSTLEAKYRYRGVAAEPTDKPVPRAYWDVRQEDPKKAQELIGGKGFTTKKIDGQGWMICKGGEKLENDNPADVWNTVLKMGKKRALVDAVLTATAASDIFTQDLEDITANMAMYQQQPSVTEVLPPAAALPPTKPAQASTVAAAPVQTPTGVMSEEDAWNTKIHFGKNEGKKLRELSPNQREYYFDTWPKETKGNSAADKRLLAAIRALAPLPSDREDVSVDAADESQERPSLYQTLCAKMDEAGIREGELTAYLCVKETRNGHTLMNEDEELPTLSDARLEKLLANWDDIRREIVNKRKEHVTSSVTTTAALPKS